MAKIGKTNWIKRIREHEANIRALDRKLNNAQKKAFPVGSVITFQLGNGTIRAKILEHSYPRHKKVRIKNTTTGKSYWVGLFWLMLGR